MANDLLKSIKIEKRAKYLNVALPKVWVSLVDPSRGDVLTFKQTSDLKLVIELEKKE